MTHIGSNDLHSFPSAKVRRHTWTVRKSNLIYPWTQHFFSLQETKISNLSYKGNQYFKLIWGIILWIATQKLRVQNGLSSMLFLKGRGEAKKPYPLFSPLFIPHDPLSDTAKNYGQQRVYESMKKKNQSNQHPQRHATYVKRTIKRLTRSSYTSHNGYGAISHWRPVKPKPGQVHSLKTTLKYLMGLVILQAMGILCITFTRD